MFLGVFAFVLAGCSSQTTCNSSAVVSPTITVVDADSGGPICDATVVASDASGQTTTLTPYTPKGGICEYLGPGVAGEYTLQASRSGYRSATLAGVVATMVSCTMPWPPERMVSLKLVPTAG